MPALRCASLQSLHLPTEFLFIHASATRKALRLDTGRERCRGASEAQDAEWIEAGARHIQHLRPRQRQDPQQSAIWSLPTTPSDSVQSSGPGVVGEPRGQERRRKGRVVGAAGPRRQARRQRRRWSKVCQRRWRRLGARARQAHRAGGDQGDNAPAAPLARTR